MQCSVSFYSIGGAHSVRGVRCKAFVPATLDSILSDSGAESSLQVKDPDILCVPVEARWVVDQIYSFHIIKNWNLNAIASMMVLITTAASH